MTQQEILDRLAEPQPLRQGVFSEMTGYTAFTLRTAIKRKAIRAVSLPGTKEPRIPIEEARRILASLGILPAPASGNGKDATRETSATTDRKHLHAVRA